MVAMEPFANDQFPQDVYDIMVLCGLSEFVPDNALDDELSIADRVAAEVFLSRFDMCLEMDSKKLNDVLRDLSKLPENPIFLTHAQRTKLEAFIEWTKQCFRFGFPPETTIFPVEASVELVHQANVHATFIERGPSMVTSARPPSFKTNDVWANWKPLMENYLRQIPGVDGFPLSYVIRATENPIYDPTVTDLQQRYILGVSLMGPTFETDTLQVHTYIANLITGNTRAEAAIQKYRTTQCGRADWLALKLTYEGSGAFSVEKVEAQKILRELFYKGEVSATHNWKNFEQQLTKAFAIYAANAPPNVIVHDNEMKLKILLEKVATCSQLREIYTGIERDMSKPNMNGMTFEAALDEMRARVNHSLLGGSTSRRISNASSNRNDRSHHPYSRNGKGNNSRNSNNPQAGRGGGGRGGRGKGNNNRNHPDAYNIRLLNGKTLSVHPSYKFTDDEFSQMHPNDKMEIIKRRTEYRQRRQVSATTTNATPTNDFTIEVPAGADTATIVSALTTQLNQRSNPETMTIRVSQTNTVPNAQTPFGGRNEEVSRRGNRHIAFFHSTRSVCNVVRSVNAARHASPQPNVSAANECDSNADTCCAGINFVILQYTNRTADVYPYDSSYEPITNVPIVTAATAYDDPDSNETVLLVLHECLYYGTSLKHTLWNPNQLRHNGVLVNDNPYDTSPNRLTIQAENLTIPLHTVGTKVQFVTRSPTDYELENCRRIELTNMNLWNPKDVVLGAVTSSVLTSDYTSPSLSPFVSDSLLASACPASIDLAERAISQIHISST